MHQLSQIIVIPALRKAADIVFPGGRRRRDDDISEYRTRQHGMDSV